MADHPTPPREPGLRFNYHFGGVELESEIALTGLRPSRGEGTGAPRITVVQGSGEAPPEDRLHFDWDGRFRMRLGETGGAWRMGSPWGTYVFDREVSTVTIYGADGPDGVVVRDLFARRLLPRLVKLKGGATYHAASLARDGKAILLMGPSGAGKSTLSVALAAFAEWDLLGDDMALVWDDGSPVVAPAAADVTIWPQSCAGLNLPPEACTPLQAYDGKHGYHPPRADRLDPVPLGGIFFLDRGEGAKVELARHTRAQAFERALTQLIYFNPSGGVGGERLESVVRLNALLGQVPAWTLRYPASFASFETVSDTIRAALKGS